MTKKDIVAAMADSAGISKAKSEKAFNAFINGVKKTMKKGGKVTLVGFGTFSVSKRCSRKGRNPQTGATITIPACKVPKFTAGKGLKDTVK